MRVRIGVMNEATKPFPRILQRIAEFALACLLFGIGGMIVCGLATLVTVLTLVSMCASAEQTTDLTLWSHDAGRAKFEAFVKDVPL